jgi:hypothetical protein
MDKRDFLKTVLQPVLDDLCQSLHRGEPVQITAEGLDYANNLHLFRSLIEQQYRELFGSDLQIDNLHKDTDGVLHVSIAKNPEHS